MPSSVKCQSHKFSLIIRTMPSRKAAAIVEFQKRILFFITFFLSLSFLVWIVAISTDFWSHVEGGEGIFVPKTSNYFLQSHHGIWRSCRVAYRNKTLPAVIIDRCSYVDFFPEAKVDETHLHYLRTVAAFSIIAILIKLMGLIFSFYTFKHTRYMYKRLAAGSHLVAAGCDLVVLEVWLTAVHYAAIHLPFRHPPGSRWHFGFSFLMGWSSFVVDAIAAIAFAICSKKRKKDKAPSNEFAMEEEPTILGR